MRRLSLIIVFILSIFIIGTVSAKDILSVDGSITNNKLSISGKTEEGILAVEIMVYDSSNNLVAMESAPVDNDNNFEKVIDVAGNEFTIKVADYDGGEYLEKKITSSSDNSNTSNAITTNSTDSGNKKSTKANNPNTYDNIIKYVVISLISFVGIAIMYMFIKYRKKTS